MQRSSWPFPGESPLARARRAAQAYRTALAASDPAAAARLDDRLTAWGETWMVPKLITYGPDDMLTAAQAGEVLCISAAAVNNLRRAGRLPGTRENGMWRYRAREVTKLLAEPRRRQRRATDTLKTDGRSVP